jgi:hypothetical protein
VTARSVEPQAAARQKSLLAARPALVPRRLSLPAARCEGKPVAIRYRGLLVEGEPPAGSCIRRMHISERRRLPDRELPGRPGPLVSLSALEPGCGVAPSPQPWQALRDRSSRPDSDDLPRPLNVLLLRCSPVATPSPDHSPNANPQLKDEAITTRATEEGT